MTGYQLPELYRKHAKSVFELSLAVQEYEGTVQKKRYTDKEIGEKLGLSELEVRNIRCMAEIDFTPLEAWLEAEDFKNNRRNKSE